MFTVPEPLIIALSVPTEKSFLVKLPEPLMVSEALSALPAKFRFPEPLITPVNLLVFTDAVMLPEPLSVALKESVLMMPVTDIFPSPLMVKLFNVFALT